MITPGQIALHCFYRPLGRLRDSLRNGGPIAERETERQRREMVAAAEGLGGLPAFPGPPALALHVMTGRRFWYQTAFCLHSLARAAERTLEVEIYDDGTIDAACRARLLALGGGIRIHPKAEIDAAIERRLPAGRFPTLRERRDNYPNLRKLTDVHVAGGGWKLVIDSDLLWFRRPDGLLEWADRPERILHAVDCAESYGYSRPLLERLAGAPMPPLVNVGVCGLRSDDLDWAELEDWCAELIARERTNYYLEQALVAMLAARAQPCRVLPREDYVTRPGREEVARPRAVMHHYVDTSKRWYFRLGWRRIAAGAPA